MAITAPLPGRLPRRAVLADLVPAVSSSTRVRDALLVTGGALFTALLAQIVVPLGFTPVPITGQTLALVLVAASLGPVRGLSSMGLYAVLGGIGLPFYSEASSGWDVVAGATGGYIVGFLPAAFLIGLAARYGADRRWWLAVPLFAAGQLVVFAVGVPWLAVTTGMTAEQAIAAGFTPFLLGGLVKAVIAGVALPGAWKLSARLRG
ncbi:biotin transport system substrate-specific component [Quadrisphaera granulorum]|uniref:Biotin transporter n=1 Tax=Quadrisphaera granulorum TaxID=317664 RepID=A0A315ZZI9_9ACTN|nr:biotin transporter BioY [Quadrisphaera granulorum]PWJ50672.1 biotin transport system substrate-specific component [Quadrisphaera granulorum]SZE97920.1 biotin transport system substrate-specific component [Quadrisphaera granulorum]